MASVSPRYSGVTSRDLGATPVSTQHTVAANGCDEPVQCPLAERSLVREVVIGSLSMGGLASWDLLLLRDISSQVECIVPACWLTFRQPSVRHSDPVPCNRCRHYSMCYDPVPRYQRLRSGVRTDR